MQREVYVSFMKKDEALVNQITQKRKLVSDQKSLKRSSQAIENEYGPTFQPETKRQRISDDL